MSRDPIASIPAFVETCPDDRDKGWANDVHLEVSAVACSDPEVRISFKQCLIALSLPQSEMLETALRVARQSVRPKR